MDEPEPYATAKGVEDQRTAALVAMGATAPVVTVLEQWQGAYAGANWYSLISVTIQDGPWSRVEFGVGFTLGETVLGGTSATLDEISTIKRIVRKWKDCGAYPARVKASTGADILGTDFVLGTSILRDMNDGNEGYSTEWIMGRRLGVDWKLGAAKLAAYEI